MDEWEIDPEQIQFGMEIGEGAFGKVYQGYLNSVPTPAKSVMHLSNSDVRQKSVKINTNITVAIKALHYGKYKEV